MGENTVKAEAAGDRERKEIRAESTAAEKETKTESVPTPVVAETFPSKPVEMTRAEGAPELVQAELLSPLTMEETRGGSATPSIKGESLPEKRTVEVKAEKQPGTELVNARPATALKQEPARAETWLVAKKGDTLSKLSVDVYGRVDERILFNLQKNNPSISNIHFIAIGQEIYFPPVRTLEEDSR
jgi:nucleoid-associated protein YgaU